MKQAQHDLNFYRKFAIKLIIKWKQVTKNKLHISEEAIGEVTNALIRSEVGFVLDKVPENKRILKTENELIKAYMLSNGIKHINRFMIKQLQKKSKNKLVLVTDLKNYNSKWVCDIENFDYTFCRKTQHDSILDYLVENENEEMQSKSREINLVIESARLTELEKDTIHKRYWDNMTLKQIADMNGTSHQNVFITCQRAKKKIAKAMLQCK